MEETGQRRKRRSVALSETGVRVVNEALLTASAASTPGKKLTRAASAELMGISERTADKVLSGQTVDRATLSLVFERLNVAWKEECFVADTTVRDPESADSEFESARTNRKRWRIALPALLCAALLGTLGYTYFGIKKDEWSYKCNLLLGQGRQDFLSARYQAAEEKANAAFELASKHEQARLMSESMRLLGDLESARGEIEDARRSYTYAYQLCVLIRDERELSAIHQSLADTELRLKNHESAKSHLRQAIEIFSKYGLKPGVAEAQRDMGTVCHEEGDYDAALSWFTSAKTSLEGLNEEPMLTDIEAREALVFRDKGNLKAAREQLESCLKYWQKQGHPRWVARTQLQLGSVTLLSGDNSAAKSLFAMARSKYDELGDHSGVSESAEWLAKCNK